MTHMKAEVYQLCLCYHEKLLLHPWQKATMAICYHNHGNQSPWQTYAIVNMYQCTD